MVNPSAAGLDLHIIECRVVARLDDRFCRVGTGRHNATASTVTKSADDRYHCLALDTN